MFVCVWVFIYSQRLSLCLFILYFNVSKGAKG